MSITFKGHIFMSFNDYVALEVEKAMKPIDIPKYAASYEIEAAKLLEEFNRDKPGELNNLISIYQALRLNELIESNGKVITYYENPSLYTNIIKCAEFFNLNKPMMYIDYQDSFNAFALGANEQLLVGIGSKIADSNIFSEKEQRFIIGHELGHQQCNHTVFRILMDKQFGFYKYVKNFIPSSKKLQNALSNPMKASRRMEISADRAGLLCCGDFIAAISALIKLHVGDEKTEKIDLSLDEIREYIGKSQEKIHSLGEDKYTHPSLHKRIYALKLFYESKMFNELASLSDDKNNLHRLEDDELNKEIDSIV